MQLTLRIHLLCVVVYRNRAYDNALLELKDILEKRGCIPVAGAAFIGEHSYSNRKLPIAEDRPDANDLKSAVLFGCKINEKLLAVSSSDKISEVKIPGHYPNGGVTELWNVDFIAVSNMCVQCGICFRGCSVGAIDSKNSSLMDKEKCITCCACVKKCPQGARTMNPGPVKKASKRLNKLYKERKEPIYFL